MVPDLRRIERISHGAATTSASTAIAEPIREVETRTEQVRDRFIQVIDFVDREIVTVIELLSPTNKVANSHGRKLFLAKKANVLNSRSNWMEIDLLRNGERSPGAGRKTPYMVYVSRSLPEDHRERLTWPITLRERLPVVGVPLRHGDADVPIDLQSILDRVIERGSYDLDFDYDNPPPIPLSGDDAAWARELRAGRPRG